MASFLNMIKVSPTPAAKSSSSSGKASQWTEEQKRKISLYDPTYNGKAAPWERGKSPEQYRGILDQPTAEDNFQEQLRQLKMMLAEGNRSARNLMESEIGYIPRYMQAQYDAYKNLYPTQAGLSETLAKDVYGRLNTDTSQSYPVPQQLVNILQKQRMAADAARGMPYSGAGSQAEAESIAQLGSNIRTQDVNTALALSGQLPAVSGSGAQNYSQYATQIANTGFQAANQSLQAQKQHAYDLDTLNRQYSINKRLQDSSGSGIGGAIGGLVGGVAGSFAGGLGTAVGSTLGRSLFTS